MATEITSKLEDQVLWEQSNKRKTLKQNVKHLCKSCIGKGRKNS